MNSNQIENPNPEPYPISPAHSEDIYSDRHLSYASKLFPLNTLVTLIGRDGIYLVVSGPYVPMGYSYPHFDVEACGERLRANVFSATRICD
jgi:hypothetical protein